MIAHGKNVGRQRTHSPAIPPVISEVRTERRSLVIARDHNAATAKNVASVSVITKVDWAKRIGSQATSTAANQAQRPNPHDCPSR
jgi:mRNA-degrading endonuclease toxin of MazEF toxin-antitoxin module